MPSRLWLLPLLLTSAHAQAQQPTVHELLEAESTGPARAAFQSLQSISILIEAWPTLSQRARVRALRIAKLHRDNVSRDALTHHACADPSAEVRKECIDIAGRSTDPDVVGALIAAASFTDSEGNRAARALASRGSPEHLELVVELFEIAPERSVLANATARLYWKAVSTAKHANVEVGSDLQNATGPLILNRKISSIWVAALARNKRPLDAEDPASSLAVALKQITKDMPFSDRFRFLQAAATLDKDSKLVSEWVQKQRTHELWMTRREALNASLARQPSEAKALIEEAVGDTSPRVRRWGIEALQATAQGKPSLKLLRRTLEGEPWPIVRAEVARGLAHAQAFEEVARLLGDPARRVRAEAMRSLDRAPAALRLQAVQHVLRRDPEWSQVQVAALEVIESGCLDVREDIAVFIQREDARAKRLHSEDALFRAIAVFAKLATQTELEKLLDDLRSPESRAAARPYQNGAQAEGCSARTAETGKPPSK